MLIGTLEIQAFVVDCNFITRAETNRTSCSRLAVNTSLYALRRHPCLPVVFKEGLEQEVRFISAFLVIMCREMFGSKYSNENF